MTFTFTIKTSFTNLQDIFARYLACYDKTSLRYPYTLKEYTNEKYTSKNYKNEKHTNENYMKEKYTNENYTNERYTNEKYRHGKLRTESI